MKEKTADAHRQYEDDQAGKPIYIDPKSDPGFKILFGNEKYRDVLILFLNAVLREDIGDPIVEVRHIDKEMLGDNPDTRKAIFDIYCETSCGKRIIVEMQHASQGYFVKRSVYYNCRAVSDQGEHGGERTGSWTVCSGTGTAANL